MHKKAIMLCAGRGSRLGISTKRQPKPLLRVNHNSILENAVEQLIASGYNELVIVIGYKGDEIRKTLYPYRQLINITFIENSEWENTNNIYSLWLAKEELNENVTLLEGDVYFDKKILEFMNSNSNNSNLMVVSELSWLMEGTFVVIGDSGWVTDMYSTKDEMSLSLSGTPYKTANIYHLSEQLCSFISQELDRQVQAGHTGDYYEKTFKEALAQGIKFKVIEVDPSLWAEIDCIYDLSISEFQFSDDRHKRLKNQHGGYWRYPITDFALIYNFHFPPSELKNKMIARFDNLLLNYPSGSGYIVHHLSHFLEIHRENLVIANGVSELIKVLPRLIKGRVALIEPSFNEYTDCFRSDQTVTFHLDEACEFNLDMDSFIGFIHKEQPEAVVMVTPNNPTGRFISKSDIHRLYRATEDLGTILIVDESFLDFSNQRDTDSFLHYLNEYPRVIVLRSMSKTFGIGGLRLGYAASSDKLLIQDIQRELPIWNINGFGEEFILNLSSYRKEYDCSCVQVRKETDELYEQLRAIPNLKVFKTDSNFILCKIRDQQMTADLLAYELLTKFNFYIKECSGKKMKDSTYFFRISSRTRSENLLLLKALQKVLSLNLQYNI
ncbi:histidinol-phosphate/aromatic aminotransferase/cobyric acid decarboxylase-like protein/choline kinase [Paenibacillus xylanexedens]|uniref:aminotransferase class I/II-fold pyridoxal phosphate-dependent enzyme n=1 Tax=Paenibacillus xylanexedens TaxID=528191 RepID=UPI0020A1E019|nr:aminotransferase class I/II-fold pyridoxal phosphate-dependent enzyme [Paenibacillus xylanexedens]MCP1427466.1 histidinol-phosphate/aromatic aminotransferase/cobyric acid decarboxylase-like protein/choline kinase [Paenibacillus xylanexedens]